MAKAAAASAPAPPWAAGRRPEPASAAGTRATRKAILQVQDALRRQAEPRRRPAGAGIRDVFLAVILSTTMSSSQSLAVILASRAAVTISDLILAGVAGSFRLLSRFA